MKQGFLIAAAVFGLALAIILGLRLEQASLAVVVGIVCGIVAGLPMSGALFYLFWRERRERLQQEERQWRRSEQAAPAAPPVIVLNAGGGRGADMLPPGRLSLGQAQPREFVIVGEEEFNARHG
jgi:hypothetical protein